MRALALAAIRLPYLRYVAVSAAALALDVAAVVTLVAGQLPPVAAAGIGYISGLALHWLLSSRLIFADRIRASEGGRRAQLVLFVISALVGLALTMAIVGVGTTLGSPLLVAKGVAIAVAFQSTWLLRRHIVFA